MRNMSTARRSLHLFKPRKRLIFSTTVVFGTLAVAYNKERLVNLKVACIRSARVLEAALLSFRDYDVTLSKFYKDDTKRRLAISDCHQRCANRTLVVMQKNGGIFLKLGQHLSAMNYILPPEWVYTFTPTVPSPRLKMCMACFLKRLDIQLTNFFTNLTQCL